MRGVQPPTNVDDNQHLGLMITLIESNSLQFIENPCGFQPQAAKSAARRPRPPPESRSRRRWRWWDAARSTEVSPRSRWWDPTMDQPLFPSVEPLAEYLHWWPWEWQQACIEVLWQWNGPRLWCEYVLLIVDRLNINSFTFFHLVNHFPRCESLIHLIRDNEQGAVSWGEELGCV